MDDRATAFGMCSGRFRNDSTPLDLGAAVTEAEYLEDLQRNGYKHLAQHASVIAKLIAGAQELGLTLADIVIVYECVPMSETMRMIAANGEGVLRVDCGHFFALRRADARPYVLSQTRGTDMPPLPDADERSCVVLHNVPGHHLMALTIVGTEPPPSAADAPKPNCPTRGSA